jgi:hypothetical protein
LTDLQKPPAIYLFRSGRVTGDAATVVCAVPLDLVMTVYGGGGLMGEGGVEAAFGGAAFFRNADKTQCFIGVWGARNASRFRSALRASRLNLVVVRTSPPARLIFVSRMPKPISSRLRYLRRRS